MADYRFTIIDSRTTLTNFSFSIPRSSPQNPHIQLPALSFDNPRTARRIKKKPLHLSLISNSYQEPISAVPSSSNLDIVSSHEHSDGSLIFRFGDSSEVTKDDDVLKDSNGSFEEVFDGECEREVIVKRNEKEGNQGQNEGLDDPESVVTGCAESSEKLSEEPECAQLSVSISRTEMDNLTREEGRQGSNEAVTDGASVSSEEFLEDPKEDQLPVSVARTEIEDSSSSLVNIENDDACGEVLDKKCDNEKDLFVKSDFDTESGENIRDLEHKLDDFEQGVESGLQNVPGDSYESYASLDQDAENDTFQECGGEDTTEKLPMIKDNFLDQNLEAESSINDLQTSDLQEVLSPEVFVLSSAAALLPHPSKVLTGGEDSYFIASSNWLGVADGVGQWAREGTNSGVYAQELMDNCEKIVSDGNGSLPTSPVEVLRSSVAKCHSNGLSTVLVAHFDGQVLHAANIGDSGFIILRNGAVHKWSSPMFHEFCFPIQIERGDDPSQLSQVYQVELDEGDIIVMATNGLFDNLYKQEIASIVSRSLQATKGPKEIAEVLATMAQEVGSSVSARSPFADAAQAAGYAGYSGGKLDDVSVIVSLVQKPASL